MMMHEMGGQEMSREDKTKQDRMGMGSLVE